MLRVDCSIATFSDLLQTLDDTWSTVWPAFNGPQKGGLSFGSCYTACGSIGFTGISGLASLVPSAIGDPVVMPTVTFNTCGLVDTAMIVVPFDSTTLTFDVVARASGFNTLWPSGGLLSENNQVNAYLSGFLLISIPRNGAVLQFTKPEIDISFQAIWDTDTLPWPNTDNPLFPSVPTATLLKQYTDALQKKARKEILPHLRNAIQKKDEDFLCSWPTSFAQTCNATTTMPDGACHPCDTCCKCLVQQRCDGECSDCACVSCEENVGWRFLLLFSSLLMVIVSLLIILAWTD